MAWSRTLLALSLVGHTFAPCLGEDLLATNFFFRAVGILRLDLARCLQIWTAAARARLIDDVICVLVKNTIMHSKCHTMTKLSCIGCLSYGKKKLSFSGVGGGGGGGGGASDSAGNFYGRSEWSVISVYGLPFQFMVCHNGRCT